MKKIKEIITVLLLLILAVGAIGGGGLLISDPSGELIGISSDILELTAFNNYLIPGIILFVMLGLLPIIIILWTLRRGPYYRWLIVSQGAILIGWLSIELMINIEFFLPMLHYPLYAIGLLLIILGLIIRKENPKTI